MLKIVVEDIIEVENEVSFYAYIYGQNFIS